MKYQRIYELLLIKTFFPSLFKKKEELHWYTVRFIYKTKKDNRIFAFTTSVAVTEQKYILNHKLIKKEHFYSFVSKNYLKDFLCNGNLGLEVICYLGKFSA